MRDMANNIEIRKVLAPVVVSDNTAQVGAIIDRLGYESLVYAISTGTLADADATFAVLLEESDASDLSGNAAVADADMIGTEAAAGFNYGDDGEVRKLGYVGSKRYTRLTITPSANSGSAPLSVIAILGNPHEAPVS